MISIDHHICVCTKHNIRDIVWYKLNCHWLEISNFRKSLDLFLNKFDFERLVIRWFWLLQAYHLIIYFLECQQFFQKRISAFWQAWVPTTKFRKKFVNLFWTFKKINDKMICLKQPKSPDHKPFKSNLFRNKSKDFLKLKISK